MRRRLGSFTRGRPRSSDEEISGIKEEDFGRLISKFQVCGEVMRNVKDRCDQIRKCEGSKREK